MCEYFGENDPSRSSKMEWTADDYLKALKKITTAEFVGFDEGLLPYTANSPAPKVRFVLSAPCSFLIAIDDSSFAFADV